VRRAQDAGAGIAVGCGEREGIDRASVVASARADAAAGNRCIRRAPDPEADVEPAHAAARFRTEGFVERSPDELRAAEPGAMRLGDEEADVFRVEHHM
jgi:hypothetical protein